ncbi:MAG: tRNA pseudouridine(55) synthase TruB [Armatimonadota bacterium]
MIGVLNIAKPGGMTSHDVVAQVRRRLGTKRVGHAGTLDPMATGVLVVAVGPATRFLQYMSLEPKVYEAEIQFGITTDSYDADGNQTETRPLPADLNGLVDKALTSFSGKIVQLPPMYSAVKVQGKALYQYARKGEEVERKERPVFVETFDVAWISSGLAKSHIVCSGGTYVRSLAHDLGEAVGCGAHLSALHRSRVGPYQSSGSIPLDEVAAEKLIPLVDALAPMRMVQVNEVQIDHVRHGRVVAMKEEFDVRFVGLTGADGTVIGVARAEGNRLHPECVLPSEAIDHVSVH